jgi:hypothetical protein
MRTRDEHVEWCKQQARPYLDRGDIENGISSMMSDMMKHDETRGTAVRMAILALHYITKGDIREARHFVEGFR